MTCSMTMFRAHKRDIRQLYNLPKVAQVDTSFSAELERKLEQEKAERQAAERKAAELHAALQAMQRQQQMHATLQAMQVQQQMQLQQMQQQQAMQAAARAMLGGTLLAQHAGVCVAFAKRHL